MKFSAFRFINSVILISTLILSLTGTYGLFWTFSPWIFDIHRAAGWVLIATLPWKIGISFRSIKRGFQANFDRGVMIFISILLSVVLFLVIGLGLAWIFRLGPESTWLRQTLISWHWMLALGLLVPFFLHVWRRWPQPRKIDFTSRRGLIRIMGFGLFSLMTWGIAEKVAVYRAAQSEKRRFTGSREKGSFSGNDFPVTHGPNEGRYEIDVSNWTLIIEDVSGKENHLTYKDIISRVSKKTVATIDCTLGWYSTQEWTGFPLTDLVDAGVDEGSFTWVRLESVSGYAHNIPWNEARHIFLATHVGGELLNHWHGFPLRAVVPTRRGWFWVKWLTRIKVVKLVDS